MTLVQSIKQFIENICVTDRQEDNIKTSLENIYCYLKDKENDLYVNRTFTNGSYDRDTIIRPLDDIDIFAVLKEADWVDKYGQFPKPQVVLTKIKNYLNGISIYNGKVKQDRPCVTIRLSDKNFDILPAFPQLGGGYLIPNYDLNGWTYSYPEQLYEHLESVHKLRSYKVKQVIKAVKQWNRELDKLIPSYHIEEVAIQIFNIYSFSNYKTGIEYWFKYAGDYLSSSKMKSYSDYEMAVKKVRAVNNKLEDAITMILENEEGEAKQIWKGIFGREFPVLDANEAKTFASAISEGSLKVGSTGILSTVSGYDVRASRGYYGGVSKN